MKIVAPDFAGRTESECDTISKDIGVTILYDYQYSSSVLKGYVISQSITEGTIITDANTITVVISITGLDSNSVVVSDFSSMKASSIMQWGTDNGVTVYLTEGYSNYISAGNVISQSIAKNTVIKKTTAITVVISKGPSVAVQYVTVPNFDYMSKTEANAWAKSNNVTITISEKYSNDNAKGTLILQSTASDNIIITGSEIKLIYSLGKVDVSSFIGRTKLDILNWQSGVNENGANIVVLCTEDYGEKGTAGTIINQSVKNDYVNVGTTITVMISRGMKIVVPDFAGKTEAECITIGRNAGLTVLFDYQYSDTVAKDYVISQSYVKDTVITDADTITINISLGTH
jgi:beta-lactam-binding protein with PASTA domain